MIEIWLLIAAFLLVIKIVSLIMNIQSEFTKLRRIEEANTRVINILQKRHDV